MPNRITTTHPVINVSIMIPLTEPVRVVEAGYLPDTPITAERVEWRFCATSDPEDFRFGGHETATAFSATHDNREIPLGALPEWVPVPPEWDALKAAVMGAVTL